jgi:hypothetical protein
VADPDLTRDHRRTELRAALELAGELRQRLRLPLLDAEHLPGVVRRAGEPEGDEPVTDRERREAVADGELDRALCSRDLRESPLAGVGVVLAAEDQGAKLGRRAGREGETGGDAALDTGPGSDGRPGENGDLAGATGGRIQLLDALETRCHEAILS